MRMKNLSASGRSRGRMMLMPMLLVMLGLIAGCSDNNNNNPAGPGTAQYHNFTILSSNMNQDFNRRMEVRVVSNSNDSVVAQAIIDPFTGSDTNLVMPNLLRNGQAYHADVWVDRNGNGIYDAPPADDAWRLDIPTNGTLSLTNDTTNFTDIGAVGLTANQPLTVNMSGLTATPFGFMEMRVVDTTTGQTVGLYRHAGTIGSNFTVNIPGVIQNGGNYRVDFFNDLNGNFTYDAPPTDQAWRLNGVGTGTGLTLTFAANNNFTDVGF